MKTHKTVTKRIKKTKTGKLFKRKGGQDHFNSRESGKVTRNKRRDLFISAAYAKNLQRFM